MKYIILGSKGQLGSEFQKYFHRIGAEYSGYDIDKIDLTKKDDVHTLCKAEKPSVIINCSAYNQVDDAETNQELAYAVNQKAVENLCEAAKDQSAFLVHYGTDYVFDGKKTTGLYTEADDPNPLTIYGKSKLAGEKSALSMNEKSLVMRLSWVFGDGKQNFIYKLRQWAKNNDMLKIVYDEFSVPTYTKTAVEVTLAALDKGLSGLYHLTNTGYCSRYEWAKKIMKTLNNDIFIYPCSISEFELPATRPKFSPMDNSQISKDTGLDIIDWETAVHDFLQQ